MAFAFVAAAHGDAISTSVTVNKPTGTADGDIEFLLLKHLANEDPNSGLTGWTQLGTRRYDATSGSSHSLYYRIAASEGASYTIGWATSGRSGATVATYRDGFDTADPIDVVSDTAYTTSNATVRAAGMTVSAANSPLIWFGNTHNSSSATMTPATNPGTFVEDVDNWNSTSRWGREIASFVWTGSGATGDMDATNSVSTTTKHAFAVALNPSGGSAATTTPGTGSAITQGRAPSAIGEINTGITTGSGVMQGRAPTLYTELQQTIGVGLVTAVGQVPTEVGTTDSTGTALPGVGSISTVGQIPDELRDLIQTPSVGLVATAGLAPSELRELTQTPSVGLVTVNGRTPTELPDRAIGPQQGLATAQGLAPTLYLERTITPTQGSITAAGQAANLAGFVVAPEVGAVATEGRAPTLYLELGITPAVGLVSLVGLAPTLSGTVVDETRGHARRRRVVRRARIVEEPSSGPVQAIVLPPDVPAYFDPPTDRLAGFNTLADALEVRLTEIEHKRAAIARRRREEEEIVRFLLRLA